MDPDELERMRAIAAETREDLARRELEDRDLSLPASLVNYKRKEAPALIYKRRDPPIMITPPVVSDSAAPFTPEQTDVLVSNISEMRSEYLAAIDAAIAPLSERVRYLEGAMAGLLGNGDRSLRSRPRPKAGR